jgi:hypothetical protein
VVEDLRVRPFEEQGAAEREHVVRVAGLGAPGRLQGGAEVVAGVQVFAYGVAAEGERPVPGHGLPEEPGGVPRAVVVGDLAEPLISDDLGDLGVGVHPVEDVAVLAQRAEQGPVEEPARQCGVPVRAGDVGQVRQNLAHPSELRAEHGFVGVVVHPRRHLVPPVGQPSDGGQRQVRTSTL